MTDLIIIGAGPYGISLAAHAAAHQLSYILLGSPMVFWREQMPQSMFIRTHPLSVQLSDAGQEYTLERFAEETGHPITYPLPRPVFVAYAYWFAESTGVQFTPELATKLTTAGEGYAVATEQGNTYTAPHVVIATGLQHYSYVPDELAALPASLLSHTFGLTDFTPFAGKKVAVIGSGQSAWEAAALLHQAGSDGELIYRRESPNYREGNSGAELIQLSEAFYSWPDKQKKERLKRQPGSIAEFLRPYVEGKVRETAQARVIQSETTPQHQVRLSLTNGEERLVDHVIAATGYRVDLSRLPFLDSALLQAIELEAEEQSAFPKLNAHFRSSVPGLYFAGPLASYSHGPAFRFIAGLNQACRSIIPHIAASKAESAPPAVR